MDQRLGIIGLGKMGTPFWRRLQSKGYLPVIYDVRREAIVPLAAQGAPVATSPRDLASRVGTILLSLPKSQHVEEVALGKQGIIEGAKPGTTVIDTTSGEPSITRRVAARLAEKGIRMIDAAVSGGAQGVEAGTLKVMIGGDKALVDDHMPLFQLLGNRVYHCGPIGAGHTTKTVHNLAAQARMMINAECLLLGAKAGLDPHQLAQVMDMGSIEGLIARRPYGATVWTNAKDYDVAIGLAQEVGAPVFVGSAAQQAMRAILGEVGPEEDLVAFLSVMERWAGVKLPSPVAAQRS